MSQFPMEILDLIKKQQHNSGKFHLDIPKLALLFSYIPLFARYCFILSDGSSYS